MLYHNVCQSALQPQIRICLAYLKIADRTDLISFITRKICMYKQNMVTGVNQTYGGEQFTISLNVDSLYCTYEMKIILYVDHMSTTVK